MLYLFDKNENLIHELASSELESLIQHEELNKLMTLEFAVFIDSNDKMKDIEYVAHKDMEDYQKIQMYRIISSESDDYTVNYQAVHIIYDELKSYGYIRDKRPEMVKASAALDIALAGSRWKVGEVNDSELLSTNFYDSTRLDALSKIIKTWNMDLHFYLTFDGNKITGRYIDLLEFRGEDTGERFVYGTNALEVVKEVDKSEVYTRVIPRGKGEEKHDENGKPTDGYGRRIKIDDVIWDKSKGNPIDKPKGQEYLELTEMTRKFGFSDGEPRTRVQIFDDIEDPKELIKAGYDFLVQVSRPLVQFKTKISKRSRTNVGDVVRIIRKDLDFYYRTRIYKAHRNLLNETLEVEFGDKLVQSPADREKIVSDSLNSLEERIIETETDLKSSFVDKVNDGITHATFNRDGYNYELKKGNKYGLQAGYYSFDREIDDNPQRVIYVGAGTLAIADSKKSNGDWNFRTFGTGEGFIADLLVAGTILGGNVRWNLEDGTFIIGKNADDYSMYWDGGTLHFRNVDIDISTNSEIKNLKNSLGDKLSKDDILGDLEIQESLKGDDGETPKIIDGMWVIGDTATDVRAEGKDALNLRAFAKDITDNGKTIIGFCLEEEKEETYPWIGSFNPRWNVDKSDMDTLRNDPKNYIWTKRDPTEYQKEITDINQIVDKLGENYDKTQEDITEINGIVGGLSEGQKESLKKLQETLTSIEQIQLSENARDEEIQATNELINYVNTQISSVEEGIANGSLNIDNLTEMLDSYIQNLPEEIQKKIESDEYLIKLKKSVVIDSKGISIGQEGSRYGINLDNEALRFYNSSSEVAYINSSRLYIQEAEILSSLKIFYLLARKHISDEGEKFVYFNWVND